jgi:tetratricopeptide (TPR) repeat protein
LVSSSLVVGCASAPKKTTKTETKLDTRQAELEPFLAPLSADEEAAEEAGRAPRRRLMTARMLLAGRGLEDVLLAAREVGEPDSLRAILLARRGAFQQALTLARRSGGENSLRLAVAVLLAAGQAEQAAAVVEEAGEGGAATVLSAWLEHRAGRSDEAIGRIRKHLFDKGRDLFAYATLARIHVEEGKLRLARLVCREGLKQAPGDGDLHYLLGTIEQMRGRSVAAGRSFAAALKAEPGHLGALLEDARRRLAGLDYVAALRSSTVAFRLAPADAEVALTYALALRANRRCDEAADLLERWSETQPVARFNLGVLTLRCRQNPAAALAILRRFVEIAQPDAGHPAHNLIVEAEALAE